MRELPPALASALEGGVTTLCHCWLLVRRDGAEIAITDHDSNLTIGARTFEANGGFDSTAIETEAGLATGGGEIAGALTSAAILPEDIEAGRYDGAELETYLVDWANPALDFVLDVSTIGEIRRSDGRFVAELRNAMHRLDEERGRLYSAGCDAEFGDPRCGADITQPPFSLTGTISETDGRLSLRSPVIANALTGLFTRGRVTFITGANTDVSAIVKDHRDGGEIILWQGLARDLAPGDTFRIVAGCDKRLATCRDRFSNALRFRGFPFIPAPEFVFSYARPGEGRHRGRPLVR